MTTRRSPRGIQVIAVLAGAVALVTGCSDADGGTTDPSAAQSAAATSDPEAAASSEPEAAASDSEPTTDEEDAAEGSADDFPTCDEVKAALAPALDALVELDSSDNGVGTGTSGPELGCVWVTQDTADTSNDLVEYGGVGIVISRDPEYTEESIEPLGWNVEDARVSAAGAWALVPGGDYDPAEQLDATGVQVVRDGVVVVLTSVGVALQDVPQLASLTNEWALGAGVTMLGLMED